MWNEMSSNQVKVEEIIAVNNIPGLGPKINGHRNHFDDEQSLCRICFGTSIDDSDLIEPCLCKGTIAKVHRNCLERWLNLRQTVKCDLCQFELRCCLKLRYGLFESIGIWFQQCRQPVLHDLSLFFIINITALSMIKMLLRNIFIVLAMPRLYFLLLCLTLLMWIAIYFALCYFIVHAQVQPWYRWWKSKKQIQLAVNWLARVFTHNKNYLHLYNSLCVSIISFFLTYMCESGWGFYLYKTYGLIAWFDICVVCGRWNFLLLLCVTVTNLWFQAVNHLQWPLYSNDFTRWKWKLKWLACKAFTQIPALGDLWKE